MFDILLFLFETYLHIDRRPDFDKLSVKLTAAGFEKDDISQALAWLSELQQLDRIHYPESINRSSMRVYTHFEEQCIGHEGLRFIAFWEQTGILSPVEREMIIDCVIALNCKNLPLDKLKLVVLMVLWSQHEKLDPLLVEDLLATTDTLPIH